jgi:hypothetical protein
MMSDAPRRRSAAVILTMAGVPIAIAALASPAPRVEMKRNLYPDRATCERDYSPQQCQQGIGQDPVYVYNSWHGPYYYSDRSLAQARSDPGPGRMGWSTATQASFRGGFGSFGRALHGGVRG